MSSLDEIKKWEDIIHYLANTEDVFMCKDIEELLKQFNFNDDIIKKMNHSLQM